MEIIYYIYDNNMDIINNYWYILDIII